MNKVLIKSIAETLGVDVEELTTGIEQESSEFKLPENLIVTTKEKREARENDIKDNHGKVRYDAGKLAGTEMTFKTLSEKAGLENTMKDADAFISSYKDAVLKDAKVEPNKKIEELETSVSNLQKKIEEKDNAYSELQGTLDSEKNRYKVEVMMPDLSESMGITREEAASLFFISHEIKEDGIYKNGNILKSDTEKPLTREEAVNAFITEKKWNEQPSGRGGGAGGGAGGGETNIKSIKTMEAYEEYLESKGIRPGSEDASSLLTEIAKENPEILED